MTGGDCYNISKIFWHIDLTLIGLSPADDRAVGCQREIVVQSS